jgi:hypothetical protein
MQTRGANSSSDSMSLSDLETQFLAELDEGMSWYEQVVAQEKSWIEDGQNPEIEYARHYAAPPSQSVRETIIDRAERLIRPVPPVVGLALAGLVALFILGRFNAARRTLKSTSETRSDSVS